MLNYYDILGIPTHATQTQIKQAYRRQCFKFHPDRNKELDKKECELKIQSISKAYKILSNVHAKRQYDNLRMEEYTRNRFAPEKTMGNKRKIMIIISIVILFHTVLTITSLVLDRMTEKQTVAESLEKRDIDFKKQFKKLSGN